MFNGQWSMMKYKIILASNSPRRKELLAGLDVQFEVRIIPGIDESYPETLPTMEIAEYIAQKKAKAYRETMADDELIITADTIVVLDDKVLGKPKDAEEARCMLHALSGKTHQVVTGVVLTTKELQKHFSVVSNVTFKTLSDNEIDYYVDTYKPMDKAGAYGIQEWIGYVGVTRLEGSYFNVMGLPVQRIYEAMKEFSICDGIQSK